MWIICNPNKTYEKQHFSDAAIALDLNLTIIDPSQIVILNASKPRFYYQSKPIDPPRYCLNWNGCMNGPLEGQIETALNQVGTVICNSVNEINHWQDKFKWQVETPLPVVKSLKVHSSNLLASKSLITANFNYPLVLKSDTGSQGQGVYLITDDQNLQQICEVISLLDKTFKVHIEQYINYDHDLRMYIIGDNYFLMERVANNDFRANVANHATVKSYPKSELTNEIFSQIRALYQSVVIGVDILLTADQFYICELNSAPGFVGIEQVCNVNIATEILKAITCIEND